MRLHETALTGNNCKSLHYANVDTVVKHDYYLKHWAASSESARSAFVLAGSTTNICPDMAFRN